MRRSKQSICRKGHPLTQNNLSVRPDGKRRCKICELEWRRLHKSEIIKRSIRWAKANRERVKEINRKHNHKRQPLQTKYRREQWWNPYNAKLRIQTLTHYGNNKLACVCCNEKEVLFLTLDHINGRNRNEKKNPKRRGWQGYQYLRARNYPKGFQTLCMNCNLGRARNKGICPHKQKISLPLQTNQISAVSDK